MANATRPRGRPPGPLRVKVNVLIKPSTKEKLTSMMTPKNNSRGKVLDELMEGL